MRNSAESKLLAQLHTVNYATIYNFQPWIYKDAKDFEGTLQWPTKIMYKLNKKELVQTVPIYPDGGRTYRYNTFYAPTGSKQKQISHNMLMHQSGIVDIALAFSYLFPEYDINFEYEYTFKRIVNGIRKTVKPDAWIRMTKKDHTEKTLDFLLEFEHTKKPEDIYNSTLKKYSIFKSLGELGLSKYTRVLVVCSTHNFNVYWRPIEYNKSNIEKAILSVRNKLNSILELAKDQPMYLFRFMAFPDFFRLNEAVWYTPQYKLVKLLSE